MGLERRKAIRDGVSNAHHLRMYGRDLHSSNEIATFLVTLTGTLRNGSVASTVREWAEYVLPLVHNPIDLAHLYLMHHLSRRLTRFFWNGMLGSTTVQPLTSGYELPYVFKLLLTSVNWDSRIP